MLTAHVNMMLYNLSKNTLHDSLNKLLSKLHQKNLCNLPWWSTGSMLVLSAVERMFTFQLGQTKTKFFFCFFTRHATIRFKRKYWSVWNQNNVYGCGEDFLQTAALLICMLKIGLEKSNVHMHFTLPGACVEYNFFMFNLLPNN